jgi:hypothetical protein
LCPLICLSKTDNKKDGRGPLVQKRHSARPICYARFTSGCDPLKIAYMAVE